MDQLRTRLVEKSAMLTRSERRIAAWLENNLEQLAFLTMSELSRETEVSEATIIRFARKLDFDSYSMLQAAAKNVLQERFSLGSRLAGLSEQTGGVLAATYKQDLDNLRHTYEHLDGKKFHAAVALISRAKRIGIIGLRASAPAAQYLAFNLNLIRPGVTQLRADTDSLHDQLLDFTSDDAVIAISLARPVKNTLDVVREARSRYNTPIIGITSSAFSSLANLSDHVLVAASEGTFNSYSAVFSLAGAILDATATNLPESASARLATLDGLNSETVYET